MENKKCLTGEEKFGQQIHLDENLGSKMGHKFFLEEIFLRRNFGEHVLKSGFLWGRKFGQQNFLEYFLGVKCHSGEEKNTG